MFLLCCYSQQDNKFCKIGSWGDSQYRLMLLYEVYSLGKDRQFCCKVGTGSWETGNTLYRLHQIRDLVGLV